MKPRVAWLTLLGVAIVLACGYVVAQAIKPVFRRGVSLRELPHYGFSPNVECPADCDTFDIYVARSTKKVRGKSEPKAARKWIDNLLASGQFGKSIDGNGELFPRAIFVRGEKAPHFTEGYSNCIAPVYGSVPKTLIRFGYNQQTQEWLFEKSTD